MRRIVVNDNAQMVEEMRKLCVDCAEKCESGFYHSDIFPLICCRQRNIQILLKKGDG